MIFESNGIFCYFCRTATLLRETIYLCAQTRHRNFTNYLENISQPGLLNYSRPCTKRMQRSCRRRASTVRARMPFIRLWGLSLPLTERFLLDRLLSWRLETL